MSAGAAASSPQCLNCEAPLEATHAYCARCGQRADTRRLGMGDIAHAAVHVLTHADHSVFALVRDLAVRPGRVAREYVQGRRKKYFNPFTFALVVVGVASVVMAMTRFVDFGRGLPANPISTFLQNNLNLVILIQLPLLALFARFFFRRDRLHFAEHLVLASYTSGFRSIFFTLVVLPAWGLLQLNHRGTVAVYLALWITYFGVACAQFYAGNRWWLWAKGVLVAVAAQLVTTVAIMGLFRVAHLLR